jgi:hypothetical protein
VWWLSQEEVSARVEELVDAGEYWCDDEQVKLVAQKNEAYTLLFVANTTHSVREMVLRFPGVRSFRKVWGEACYCAGEGAVAMSLEAYTVQIWQVLYD